MSVQITILKRGTINGSSEYNAAKQLKESFDQYFSSRNYVGKGLIYIVPSATLIGQKVKDIDLIVVGEFKPHLEVRVLGRKKYYVDNFCFVVELKDHNCDSIYIDATHLMVQYQNNVKDATEQNENQKYAFKNYFENEYGYSPFIGNFIWLRQVPSLEGLKGNNPLTILPSHFTFDEMIEMLVLSMGENHRHKYIGTQGTCFLHDFKKLMSKKFPKPTGLTRKKYDYFTKRTIKENPFTEGQLTVFKGKAGTGKTFQLIDLAIQLATGSTPNRCLILTYNHALVSDIRRLLHFMNIPDSIDSYSVQISTLHSFFIGLIQQFDSSFKIDDDYFEQSYTHGLSDLYELVKDSMTDEIEFFKDKNSTHVDWDYVFIDEAQDWTELEKNILFKIYGPHRIIVADGVDQFIRTDEKLRWDKGIEHVSLINNKVCLRQKFNLVSFVNAYAQKCDLNWNIKGSNKLCGGRVIISESYTHRLHTKLVKECHAQNCDNYDFLFLVPPSLVCTKNNNQQFAYLDAFSRKRIRIFDGTNRNLRREYPTRTDEFRLYQYESCRGLEGWCVVCLHFDDLIKYKLQSFSSSELEEGLSLSSPEDRLKRMVWLWSLMPLTRAIDTLVITLKDPNSEVAAVLYDLADELKDFTIIYNRDK